MTFIDACRHFISIDTTPSGDIEEAVSFLKKISEEMGLFVEIQREYLHGLVQENILISNKKLQASDVELMLQTHIDTPDPGPYSHWTRTGANPFAASIYDQSMYGLGTADTKLDLICKIFAAKEYVNAKLNKNFVIVGTYGAHSSMEGAIRLIRKKKLKPKFALVGEPTDLMLATQGMGLAVIEVFLPFTEEEKKFRFEHDSLESSSSQSKLFYGKASHSTVPQMGDNALEKLLKFLEQLPSGISILEVDGGVSYNTVPASAYLEFDLNGGIENGVSERLVKVWKQVKILEDAFKEFREEGFLYPYTSLNLGTMRTTPDGVWATGSCRLIPSVSDEISQSWLNQLDQTIKQQGGNFKIVDYKAPYSASESSMLFLKTKEVLKGFNKNIEMTKISACSEASVFQKLGVECVVFGPGVSTGNSHEPNEKINILDLEFATNFYSKLIGEMCL